MSKFVWLLSLLVGTAAIGQEPDTLPALTDDVAPRNLERMWAGFDPRAEPLEVETLTRWEEDGVVLREVRFRIGVFKGQKALLVAVYGYPKGRSKLPGLVQINGGGQYADHKAPLYNAKRGYATVSIAWAGRISAPGYRVSPTEVRLFWDGKTDNPAYRLTTDWGALDGYHRPMALARSGVIGTSVPPARPHGLGFRGPRTAVGEPDARPATPITHAHRRDTTANENPRKLRGNLLDGRPH